MKETAEELLKRTRSELVEMAEKLGISSAGLPKPTIAQNILEAGNKPGAKQTPKPRFKAPVKAQPMPRIGKKGVLAKRAAIDAQIKENEEAAAVIGTGVREMQNGIKDMRSAMDKKAEEMLQEGAAKLQKGVDEMHKSISTQIKMNEKAAAKMDLGVKEVHRGIKEFQSAIDNKTFELQKGVKEMHIGVEVIQKGIEEMETRFGEFQNETANYIKDFYYG